MDLTELKKTHAQFAFIHTRLTQSCQYFVDEFEIARDAIKTITEMTNKLGEDIQKLETENAEKTSAE